MRAVVTTEPVQKLPQLPTLPKYHTIFLNKHHGTYRTTTVYNTLFSSIISGRYHESQLNEVSDNARVNEYIAQSQSFSASSHPAIFTQLLIAVQENCKI